MPQAFISGWGGLRVTRAGLRLLTPSLPLSVGALTLRNMTWRNSTITIRVTTGIEAVSVSSGSPLCLVAADGTTQVVAAGGAPVILPNATYPWPGLLSDATEGGTCG